QATLPGVPLAVGRKAPVNGSLLQRRLADAGFGAFGAGAGFPSSTTGAGCAGAGVALAAGLAATAAAAGARGAAAGGAGWVSAAARVPGALAGSASGSVVPRAAARAIGYAAGPSATADRETIRQAQAASSDTAVSALAVKIQLPVTGIIAGSS